VAISNKRLIKADEAGVTFTFKDYRKSARPKWGARRAISMAASRAYLPGHGGMSTGPKTAEGRRRAGQGLRDWHRKRLGPLTKRRIV
jgi:hypothetical protein